MSYKSVREILNSVFDSDDHALKTIFKTDGEVLNMVLDESGAPALKVRMDGSAGSGLTDEEKTALAKASKNYLINPFDQAFCINQRCYVSGTVVSGGTYMYDRWKASGGDASITFDGEYYSISGTIEQVIESPALSGQTVLLSGDTGGTTVECEVDGQTGTLPMTVTISGTGHIPVKLTGGKVKNVKLGFNDTYIPLSNDNELMKCQRYYFQSKTGEIFTLSPYRTSYMSTRVNFPVPMRTEPNVDYTEVNFSHLSENAYLLGFVVAAQISLSGSTTFYITNIKATAEL